MATRLTDKQIRKFLWEAYERPFDNKASYLLSDLSGFGVSRCKKLKHGWQGVWYEFNIYLDGDSRVFLAIELSIDFTLKEVEGHILSLYENGGLVASDDERTFNKWKKVILPVYNYEHARYSALKFLEALRKKMLSYNTVINC